MVTTLGAAALIGAQLAGMTPATAVSGLVRATAVSSGTGASKSAQANCPAGKRVVGGGATVSFADPADANKVRLAELRPVHPGSGADGYVGGAQEVGAGGTGTWQLQVSAVCADPIPGLHLVASSGPLGSASVQSVSAGCPAGEVVLGGGGLVRNPGFQADLRTVAPSANGDRFTAIGGEDVDGYPDNWSVVAYAMCAPRPAGYEIVASTGLALPTESRKAATTLCPAGKHVHGVGAATSQSPLGGIGLEEVMPQPSLSGAQALAVITEPVTADWGPVRAFAICAI
jgi:hypothetical protein